MSKEKIIEGVATMLVLNSTYQKHFELLATLVEQEKWDEMPQLRYSIRQCDEMLCTIYSKLQEVKQEAV